MGDWQNGKEAQIKIEEAFKAYEDHNKGIQEFRWFSPNNMKELIR